MRTFRGRQRADKLVSIEERGEVFSITKKYLYYRSDNTNISSAVIQFWKSSHFAPDNLTELYISGKWLRRMRQMSRHWRQIGSLTLFDRSMLRHVLWSVLKYYESWYYVKIINSRFSSHAKHMHSLRHCELWHTTLIAVDTVKRDKMSPCGCRCRWCAAITC